MTPLTIVILLSVAAFTVGIALLVARMAQYGQAGEHPAEEFDAARYEPMARLLDPQEAAFLAGQPGIDAGAVAAFRRERRRVFRAYLRELGADFSSLHAQARQLVAASPEKHSELVGMLLRQQVRFWLALAGVEVQLLLDAAGLGAVNPAGLLATVDGLSAAVHRATAVPGPVRVL